MPKLGSLTGYSGALFFLSSAQHGGRAPPLPTEMSGDSKRVSCCDWEIRVLPIGEDLRWKSVLLAISGEQV